MRRASVAFVPLMLGIFILFWFIWFMGGENDNLHRINEVENLQHLQERLLLAAVKHRYDVSRENPNFTEAELDAAVNIYIQNMMKLNGIDE